jgi:arginase family enzyme
VSAARRVSLLGVPTSAGSHNPGQEQAPAAWRAAGLADRLLEPGQVVLFGFEVSPAALRRYNSELQRRLRRAVWSEGGCTSWYLDPEGINRGG